MKNIILVGLLVVPVLIFARPVTIKTQSVTTPTLSPAQVLAKNKERQGLIISNNGADAILVQFGTSSASTLDGITVPINGIVDFTNVPMDAVFIKLRASTGVNRVGVQEFE